MCLDTITCRHRPNKRVVTVVKVFRKNNGYLQGLFQGGRIPVNRWISCKPAKQRNINSVTVASDGTLYAKSGGQYFCGFHGYVEGNSETEWSASIGREVRKVRFKDIRITGIQSENTVVVARMMFVPSLRKKKKK